MATKIFLVEDSEVTRTAVQHLLKRIDGMEVVGTASDGQSAVEAVLGSAPDVVLMDIGLPVLDGIEATKQIRSGNPNIKVLMVTASKTDHDTCAAFAAGANGYIVKESINPERLETAVRSVAKGDGWLDAQIAQYVLDVAVQVHQFTHDLEPLSSSERETLEQVAHNPGCTGDTCSVDPDFFRRLHRFSKTLKS
ncbi:MAG: response regulator transcription factor [Candidatus Obscuribacterales bacterium]